MSAPPRPVLRRLSSATWPIVPVLCALVCATAAAEPPPPPPAAPTSGGYWLGAHLLGPGPGVLAATEAMSLGTSVEGAPTSVGAVVGQVGTIHDAMRFVARWAFAAVVGSPRDRALRQPPAPVPGGDLLPTHGAVLVALTVQGRSPDGGSRTVQWPKDQAELLPPELAWIPAALVPDRAPLFAAPAARVPPTGERFALARRSGSLFVLGALDRCDDRSPPLPGAAGEPQRVCLRWYQVVARDGERFQAGYLPAFQVALLDDWRRGQGALPRAQLIASGTRGATAQFVLLARARDNAIHRLTLEAPLVGDAFPEATLTVDGDWAEVRFAGAAPRRIALDATMDARPR
ncbi:hypothetical protein SAMN02745121_00118 [Nannocystis exedens]|uniref:Uncharacterized protein n=1 Tax=Nannocystis exedens TaxID=54 RepID=A0A1I1SLI8_9BACT|nr:hypothetical protein [Nannocystis exedens]PCC75577.1 hypothetical protein NAEX_08689 [Nannocystis exedens]SFD47339.1 hypothetical protein SAMN02745121_00118 [Nannocystis exedens]